MRHVIAFSSAGLSLGLGSMAFAVPLPPDLQGFDIVVEWGETGEWHSASQPNSITSVVPGTKAGTYTVSGGWVGGSNWAADWVIDLDIDPAVSSSFNITNPSGITQVYSVSVILPVPALGGPTVMEGKLSGNLLDADFSGSATAGTIPGNALYRALVDLGGVHDEYAFPYSLTTSDIDPLPVVTWGPDPGPGIVSSIGINNTFSLTAGDTFQMVSIFKINAIPAPGALALLGFAGAAASRRRR